MIRHDRRRINEAVFDEFSEATAWLLGLLWADGTWGGVRQSIGLSSTDLDLIEKTAEIVDTDYPIYTRDPLQDPSSKGKRLQYRLYINSRRLCDRLTALAGGRLKTERIRIPVMSAHLVPHFIRGYWDGDGGVSIKSPQAYLCANRPLMHAIVPFLEAAGIRVPSVTSTARSPWIAKIHISRADDLETLFDYLYHDATYFGNRKREVWSQLLAIKREAGGNLPVVIPSSAGVTV